MSATLQSRINQTDAMLLAVGKRVVELNAGIEGIDAMNRSLSSFSERTDAIMAAQAKLEEQIKVSLGESKDLVNSLPAQTAKSVEGISKNIAAQVVAMDAQMKKQASAMALLGGQVKSLRSSETCRPWLRCSVNAISRPCNSNSSVQARAQRLK